MDTKITLSRIKGRVEIARRVAKDLKAGATVSEACNKARITRMCLWQWCHKHPDEIGSLVLPIMEARRKERQVITPVRESLPKPVPLRVKQPLVKCNRCGHEWTPRQELVCQCPHPTCGSRHFALNCFSPKEKREAREDRKRWNENSQIARTTKSEAACSAR